MRKKRGGGSCNVNDIQADANSKPQRLPVGSSFVVV